MDQPQVTSIHLLQWSGVTEQAMLTDKDTQHLEYCSLMGIHGVQSPRGKTMALP